MFFHKTPAVMYKNIVQPQRVDSSLEGAGWSLLLLPDRVSIGSLLLYFQLIYHLIPHLSNECLLISLVDRVISTSISGVVTRQHEDTRSQNSTAQRDVLRVRVRKINVKHQTIAQIEPYFFLL